MKHIPILIIFLCCYICKGMAQRTFTPKSAVFQKYQQENAYKGIRFGTKLSDANSKLMLHEADLLFNMYSISNYKFTKYSGLQFDEGEAYFTDDAELYQVVVHQDSLIDGLYAYQKLRSHFLKLFGNNESERADLPTKMISWEGTVISVTLTFDPHNDNNSKDGSVRIKIFNRELSNKSTNQMLKKNKPVYNPEDPIPEI